MKKLYPETASVCNFNCKTCFRQSWFDESTGMMCEAVLDAVYKFIQSDVKDILNTEKYREFRCRVHEFEVPDCALCNGCDDRKENKTDCLFYECLPAYERKAQQDALKQGILLCFV